MICVVLYGFVDAFTIIIEFTGKTENDSFPVVIFERPIRRVTNIFQGDALINFLFPLHNNCFYLHISVSALLIALISHYASQAQRGTNPQRCQHALVLYCSAHLATIKGAYLCFSFFAFLCRPTIVAVRVRNGVVRVQITTGTIRVVRIATKTSGFTL